MAETLAEKMEAELSEKLEDAFETVINQKNAYYQNNPREIPSKKNVSSLISSVALTNSAISGGATLIPGPWGMLAVVPEIMLVTRNQIALIYDIAAANNKDHLMSKELAVMVFVSALGTSVGGLVLVHGGKYLVKRSGLQMFQKLVVILGGKITQQALKSAVGKYFPVLGAAALAYWSNYMTRQIGNKANEILASEFEFENTNDDNYELIKPDDVKLIKPIDEIPIKPEAESKTNEYYRIKVLINLMKIDGAIKDEELTFLSSIIENSAISSQDKISLISSLSTQDRSLEGIDFNLISASPSDSIALMSDLTALAKKDGEFHITEKLFIKQVGKLLNFSESDIDEVMSSI